MLHLRIKVNIFRQKDERKWKWLLRNINAYNPIAILLQGKRKKNHDKQITAPQSSFKNPCVHIPVTVANWEKMYSKHNFKSPQMRAMRGPFIYCIWDDTLTQKCRVKLWFVIGWKTVIPTAWRPKFEKFFQRAAAKVEFLLSNIVQKTSVVLRFIPTSHTPWMLAVNLATKAFKLCIFL